MDIHPISKNYFSSIRLFLAFCVLIAHVRELSEVKVFDLFHYLPGSFLAINCFFIISGFLVFKSFENSPSLSHYFKRRIGRIYPAYAGIIFLSLGLGICFSSFPFYDFLFSYDTLKYFFYNLLFLNFMQPTLPGLFEYNYISAVNGSLWTLKIECMFYLSVPIIYFLSKKTNRTILLVALYLLSAAYVLVLSYWYKTTGNVMYYTLYKQFPGQLMYFVTGAFVYFYFNFLKSIFPWILLPSIFLYFMINQYIFLSSFTPLVLAGILFPIAFTQWLPFNDVFRKTDISYGLYLIHFPVIQLFVQYHLFQSAWIGFFACLMLIILLSWFSWIFIEKRFIFAHK